MPKKVKVNDRETDISGFFQMRATRDIAAGEEVSHAAHVVRAFMVCFLGDWCPSGSGILDFGVCRAGISPCVYVCACVFVCACAHAAQW